MQFERFFEAMTTGLAGVPATFWGVVAGSFFTLLGVIISNRASEGRQASQFQHELSLKKQERELALRKEVYLAAAEAIQDGALSLGSLANLDLAVTEVAKQFTGKVSAIAKVQIIAEVDTIEKVTEAWGSLGAAIIKLTGRRLPLDFARGRLNDLKAEVAGLEKERDRWLEQMKQYNLAGTTNERLWKTLQGNFAFEEQQIAEMRAVIASEGSALCTKHRDFTAECLTESRAVAALLVPAIVAIRGELGVAGDERRFRDIVESSLTKQKAAVDAFLETARIAVNQP